MAKRDRHGRIIAGIETTDAEAFERLATNIELDEIDAYANFIRRERHIHESFKSARERIRVATRPQHRAALRELALARTAILARNRIKYELHCARASAKLQYVQTLIGQVYKERASKNTGRPPLPAESDYRTDWLKPYDDERDKDKLSKQYAICRRIYDGRPSDFLTPEGEGWREAAFDTVYEYIRLHRKE